MRNKVVKLICVQTVREKKEPSLVIHLYTFISKVVPTERKEDSMKNS